MFRIVQNAARRPGKCALSGESTGPFIDTNKDIKRYGRVYLSVRFFDEPLRELGYIGPLEYETLQEKLRAQSEQLNRLATVEEDLQELVDAVKPYIPVPEPKVIKQVEHRVDRPTDEEIAQWISENGADHPIVQQAKKLEKGSSEEWDKLYRDKHDKPKKVVTTKEQQAEAEQEQTEFEAPEVDEGPDKIVTLMDQEIDLDKLLSEDGKTIVSVAEGKPEEFIAALVKREWYLAESKGRQPRKNVLLPLEYWDEEENEALYPSDESDEESDTITL